MQKAAQKHMEVEQRLQQEKQRRQLEEQRRQLADQKREQADKFRKKLEKAHKPTSQLATLGQQMQRLMRELNNLKAERRRQEQHRRELEKQRQLEHNLELKLAAMVRQAQQQQQQQHGGNKNGPAAKCSDESIRVLEAMLKAALTMIRPNLRPCWREIEQRLPLTMPAYRGTSGHEQGYYPPYSIGGSGYSPSTIPSGSSPGAGEYYYAPSSASAYPSSLSLPHASTTRSSHPAGGTTSLGHPPNPPYNPTSSHRPAPSSSRKALPPSLFDDY